MKNTKTPDAVKNKPNDASSAPTPESEALAASELRYRRLFEMAKDGILILDAESGIVVDVNPFLTNLLGYPYEDFVGKAVWELGFFGDIVANQAHFKELQEKEYIRYEDIPLESSDGRRQDVEFISNVYLEDNKKIIQCNIRDITERKRAAEELRASQQITEGIINAIPVRVFWKDKNLVFQGCNAAFAHDAGFADAKELIGKDDYQMAWRDQAERYRDNDRQVIESGNSFFNQKETQTTPGGNTITLLTSKVPLRNVKGEITGVLGTYVDITGQLHMEAKLRQAQKMEAVGRLAGGVAHDFNNILGIILGYTDVALKMTDPSGPLFDNLHKIRKAAERSAKLTRQLMAFASKQAIAPKILNLNDAVTVMLKMLQRLIREDINLVWRPGANLSPVKIDPAQVDQILANLCLNAQDAIAGAGRIVLETGNVIVDDTYCAAHAEAVPGAYVFLAVSDNGSGMDKKTLTHIFEPFFSTKNGDKGTGLGLATVYGIVKQNNGFIYAYSEPGHGATFRIYLPQAASEEVKSTVTKTPGVSECRGETILLAEDEPALRTVYKLFLDNMGYQVLLAENAENALDVAARHPGDIHLLMTDVIMPGMNGRQLAEQIYLDRPEIKVLFMSGYADDLMVERGVLKKDAAFIEKPFTFDELAHKLHDTLAAVRR